MLSGWLLFQFAETGTCIVNDMWEVRRRQDGLRCKVVKHNLAELHSFFACTTDLLTVLDTAGDCSDVQPVLSQLQLRSPDF